MIIVAVVGKKRQIDFVEIKSMLLDEAGLHALDLQKLHFFFTKLSLAYWVYRTIIKV
jgi:hypothetical protein